MSVDVLGERFTYTVPESAGLTGLHAQTIRRLVVAGQLKAVNVGRRVLISAESLRELVGAK